MFYPQEVESFCFPQREMRSGVVRMARILLIMLGLCVIPAEAQMTSVVDENGKRVFINADEPVHRRIAPVKSDGAASRRTTPGQAAAFGNMNLVGGHSKEYLERLVHETANRHRVDPALVKAVVATESSWNPRAISHKGAVGLMQLIPGTAERMGVRNAFDPQENLDGGVRYLRSLLERYNGDLHLSLAAYNAGERAVARAGGVPRYRETRNYVQKITDSYFRPGSDRQPSAWGASRPIYRLTDERGRVVFTNE